MQMPQAGRHRHAPWEFPSDPETVLWRYMDLARFVSLLKTESLFFSRIDSLEDQFEGSLTKSHYDLISKDEASRTGQIELRKTAYVNCWFCQEQQSTAMWKIYGGSQSSIAIRTTLGRLVAALPAAPITGGPNIGLVDYVDHRIAQPLDRRNILTTFFQKDWRYSYENELRVLIWNGTTTGETQDQTRLPVGAKVISDKGLICPVTSLPDLIDMVFVHFEAGQWFWDVVHDLLGRYSPSINLQKFELIPTPLI